MIIRNVLITLVLSLGLGVAACQPRIEVMPPKEPITINLNVRIEHEIRVKVDRDLDQLFEEDPSIF